MQNIKLIILFGSRATGKAGKYSDADVAVLADHSLTIEEKIELGEKIANKLGINDEVVDIVDIWSAPPLLQYQIAKAGKLLEGRETDFLRFKVLAWKRYQGTAKFRRIRDETLRKAYAK